MKKIKSLTISNKIAKADKEFLKIKNDVKQCDSDKNKAFFKSISLKILRF
mgnify:CR=1 FL=1